MHKRKSITDQESMVYDYFKKFDDLQQLSTVIKEAAQNKQDIYSKIVSDLGVPRPTVRRVARDLRNELLEKIKILESEAKYSESQPIIAISKQKKSGPSKILHKEFEKVKKDLELVEVEESSSEFEQNKRTFANLKSSLLKNRNYTNKFVAIVKNKIDDNDSDEVNLAKRVYEKHGYIPMYIGLVSKKEKVTKIPSIYGAK